MINNQRDILDDIFYMIGTPENYSRAEILEKLNEAADAIDRLRTLFRMFCEPDLARTSLEMNP